MSIRIEELEQTDFRDVVDASAERIAPTSPGDILRHDFMEPLEMSANGLARELNVPANRITGILNGSRRVSADTALRLARYFGSTAQFWLGLQAQYDLEVARRRDDGRIEQEINPRETA